MLGIQALIAFEWLTCVKPTLIDDLIEFVGLSFRGIPARGGGGGRRRRRRR